MKRSMFKMVLPVSSMLLSASHSEDRVFDDVIVQGSQCVWYGLCERLNHLVKIL